MNCGSATLESIYKERKPLSWLTLTVLLLRVCQWWLSSFTSVWCFQISRSPGDRWRLHFTLTKVKTRSLRQRIFKCACPISIDPVDRNQRIESVLSTESAEEVQKRKKNYRSCSHTTITWEVPGWASFLTGIWTVRNEQWTGYGDSSHSFLHEPLWELIPGKETPVLDSHYHLLPPSSLTFCLTLLVKHPLCTLRT